MKLEKHNKSQMIRADITPEEKAEANQYAKSQGMTFQGFVGQLIKKALKEATNGNPQ